MKIDTTRFGELNIDDAKVIQLTDGMIGFPERQFILLHPDHGGPFCWLQATGNPALAFVVIDPSGFIPDYRVKLTGEENEALRLAPEDELLLLSVVTMSPVPSDITINLQGPIVLNPASMTGRQVVLDASYPSRYKLFAQHQTQFPACDDFDDADSTFKRTLLHIEQTKLILLR